MKREHVCSKPGCPNFYPCPTHSRPRNARWSKDRDPREQGRFRAAVMRRSRGICERCHSHPAAVAHHVRPGYDPDAGLALCDTCHAAVDDKARRTR
jgi:hypothetical protein